jgi:spermidine/putrescine transport system permease protein
MSNVVPPKVRAGLAAISWPVYILLYTPLAMVAYYSFAPAPLQTGHSFHGYSVLFSDGTVATALQRSLILAFGSATVSTALGTLLGYGLCRFRAANARGFAANLPSLIIYTPIIMPSLVFGISELIFFNFVHTTTGLLAAGLGTMVIAHITFQIPYVALSVFARLAGLDPNHQLLHLRSRQRHPAHLYLRRDRQKRHLAGDQRARHADDRHGHRPRARAFLHHPAA